MSKINCIEISSNNTLCNCFNTNRHCCDFMINCNINLQHCPCNKNCVKYRSKVKSQIVKICSGKIIIDGILFKKIFYTSYDKCSHLCRNYCFIKKIPFSNYISVDQATKDDLYKITGCDVICNYCKLVNNRNCCFINFKDIIAMTIEKID